jgi:lauroyl/myristoyl acyltransferase
MLTQESMLKHIADMCAAAIHDKKLCERAADRAASVLNDNRIEYAKDTPAGRVVFVTAWRYNFDALVVMVDANKRELLLTFTHEALPAFALIISKDRESAVSINSEYIALHNMHNRIILNTVKNIVRRP